MAAMEVHRQNELFTICDLQDYDNNNLDEAGKEFKTMIPDGSHREQVLHEAVCANVTHSLYVEASTFGIRHAVLVIFSQHILNEYKSLIQYMTNTIMPWLYNPTDDRPGVPHFSPNVLGRAVDQYTFDQYLDLWKGCVAMVQKDGKPLPPTVRVCPSKISHWNGSKSAVDNRSREVPKTPYHSIWQEALLTSRSVMHHVIAAHHAWKAVSVYPNLNKYHSVSSLSRANERNLTKNRSFSDAMKFFRIQGNEECRQEAWGILLRGQEGTEIRMTRQKKETFFKSETGKIFRIEGDHILEKNSSSNNVRCVLCGNRTPWFCTTCQVALCTTIRTNHPLSESFTNNATRGFCCKDLFHNSNFTYVEFKNKETQINLNK